MKQVQNLLVKLGEIPPPQGSRSPIRRIDASSTPETYDYLLQLQKQWQTISPVPLVLPQQEQFVDPLQDDAKEESEDSAESEETDTDPKSDQEPKQPDVATTTSFSQTNVTTLALNQPPATPSQRGGGKENAGDSASGNDGDDANIRGLIRSGEDFDRLLGNPPTAPASSNPKPTAPLQSSGPVQINLDRDGNLVLSGADPRVLDQLEDLMLRFAPPRRPYHVFRIRNQSAYWVHLNLTEYFEEEEEEGGDDDFFRWWIGAPSSGDDDDGPTGLGKNAKLRFIYDPDTNTIVVSGATSTQLKTIAELIELWDVAEPVNKRSLRYTKLIEIKHGQAAQIAETIKEAYRDLLSSNDKTFQRGPAGGGAEGGGGGASGPGNAKSSGRGNRGSGLTSDSGKDGGDVDFSFQGKLSMGIDPIGNTLLISAEGEPLLQPVEDMIKQLDEASQSAGHVEMYTLRGDTSSPAVETLLKTLAKKVKVQQGNGVVGANGQAVNAQPGQPQPGTTPSAGGNSLGVDSF